MKPGFSVLRFSLHHAPDGHLTQKVRSCGEFASVERAFDTARAEALREWHEALAETDHEARVKDIKIRDTEWGYELKRDHLTIARYWVHDGKPADLAGI